MQTRGESIKGLGYTLSDAGLKELVAQALWFGAYSFVVAKPDCSLEEIATYLRGEIKVEHNSARLTKRFAVLQFASSYMNGTDPALATRAFHLLGEAGFLGDQNVKG